MDLVCSSDGAKASAVKMQVAARRVVADDIVEIVRLGAGMDDMMSKCCERRAESTNFKCYERMKGRSIVQSPSI